MKPVYLLPLAIFLLAAAIFAWRLNAPEDPHVIPSALIGKPVPQFDLPPLEGRGTQGLASKDLANGQVTLVNAWASWCTPCRAESAALLGLKQRGIIVHGLVYKDKPAPARDFLAELGDPFARLGFDPDGSVGIDWGLTGVPETYVVDGKGMIVAKHVGPLDDEVIRKEILPAIAAASAPR
jgi:cytochrome c biogenesis protein CcmG, thiol:disulfide interchange protein DsbE